MLVKVWRDRLKEGHRKAALWDIEKHANTKCLVDVSGNWKECSRTQATMIGGNYSHQRQKGRRGMVGSTGRMIRVVDVANEIFTEAAPQFKFLGVDDAVRERS